MILQSISLRLYQSTVIHTISKNISNQFLLFQLKVHIYIAKIKFFMPKMPGMPYMEFEDKAKLVGDKYKLDVNFSMGGTWQYQLKVKTSDGKIHKIRGSVNL